MKDRPVVSVLAVAVALLGGCSFLNTYVDNKAGQTQGGTGTSPDVLPSAGLVASVSISKFGEDSCSNPTDNPTTVRVGCTARLTCTPKLADGTDAPVAVHGPAPDFFGATSGAQFISAAQEDNPFNLQARGLGPGTVTFSCTAKGVSSSPRTLEVVN